MNIRKVKNGYIVSDRCGLEEICMTLEDVFSKLLLTFEGRSKWFGGASYGRVEIHNTPNKIIKPI